MSHDRCTGKRCPRRVCRDARKARLHREWEEREARRPPMEARLVAMFKEVYGGSVGRMWPNAWRPWEAIYTPEQRAERHANRQRLREEGWAHLPKVVIQDDRWRARFGHTEAA